MQEIKLKKHILLAFIATLSVLATLLAGTASASPTRMGSGLAMDINGIHQTQHDLAALEHQLMQVCNRRDELYLSAWDRVKRVRASIKGMYGDDASEYEMVGGTRRSDRKRARRTPVT